MSAFMAGSSEAVRDESGDHKAPWVGCSSCTGNLEGSMEQARGHLLGIGWMLNPLTPLVFGPDTLYPSPQPPAPVKEQQREDEKNSEARSKLAATLWNRGPRREI